jgi:hypothetical protein
MKIYHQHDIYHSIYSAYVNGPVFGGHGDITICDKSNANKSSYTRLTSSYGKNESANERDLT